MSETQRRVEDQGVTTPKMKMNDGYEIPVFGLGTWLSEKGKVREAVITAIEAGSRHIDGAYAYFNEDEVGEGIADCIRRGIVSREDLFVTTKLSWTHNRKNDAEEALRESLTALKLDYVDLYLMHMPWSTVKDASFPPEPEKREGYSPENVLEVWGEFERFKREGLVRSIGVSNFTVHKLEHLVANANTKPAVNQVEMHPGLQQHELLRWCKEHGIIITAYSPLGNPGRPELFQWENDPEAIRHPKVLAIAEKHKATPAQVLLAWGRQRGTVVIPKSVTPARIVENQLSLQLELDAEDMEQIRGLDRHRRLLRMDFFAPAGKNWWDMFDEPEPPADSES